MFLLDPKHKDGKDGLFTIEATVEEFAADPLEMKFHGILMAPPCTHFTVSGNRLWKEKDEDGRTAEALATIDACLAIKDRYTPKWWCLENPVGRLRKLRRDALGEPRLLFHPYYYGDPYTKKTLLWGDFNPDLPRNEVSPTRYCKQGSWLQQLGGSSERTKELRSATPPGFARAFFLANP